MSSPLKHPDVDYGPLLGLIGSWSGNKGIDISPEPDGTEESPYYETIVIEEAGTVENAEQQELAVVRYLQLVSRKSNDKVFHDQTGYWMWDARAEILMFSLAIPRGVCLVAGGSAQQSGDAWLLRVESKAGSEWDITQSPFMAKNARTNAFSMTVRLEENTYAYSQEMPLSIYGREFQHTDGNRLIRG
jgi:hypothetical protein